MKSTENDKANTGENRGVRVSCGSTGVKPFLPLPFISACWQVML